MHTHGCLISTATGVVMSLLGVLLLYVGLFVWPVLICALPLLLGIVVGPLMGLLGKTAKCGRCQKVFKV